MLNGSMAADFTIDRVPLAPGNYTVNYTVSPGLHGKSRPANGQNVTGSFRVRISDQPVPARVNAKGEVVREKD